MKDGKWIDTEETTIQEAYDIIIKLLLNLKIGGKLFITKTINYELIKFLILNLDNTKYQYDYIIDGGKDYNLSKTLNEQVQGIIITRLI